MNYKLLGYRDHDGNPRAGLCDDSEQVWDIVSLTGDSRYNDMRVVMGELSSLDALFSKGQRPVQPVGKIDELKILAPFSEPGAIFCAAANFVDHMMAMAKKLGIAPEADPRKLDVKPYHFLKAGRQCLVGDAATVTIPEYAKTMDWEIELAAIIGTPAHNVSAEDALDHVAGYAIANDLSCRDRDLMKRTNVPDGSLFRTDFIGMKVFDGSCPLGPWIVPASQVKDPQNLDMRLWLNDELMQNSSTSKMVFSTAEQISFLSTRMTLLPGDIILTGTPAGTGAEQDRFLKPGDQLKCWIDGMGELRTTMA